ncbi:uncharacterized protein [Rutidosis leptorrhynchoides]|uniref:uncharacterized protein n=1 Tax=Rutidosis leptorrhynchoides TaxID=125765 RepID=UPI003A9933A0
MARFLAQSLIRSTTTCSSNSINNSLSLQSIKRYKQFSSQSGKVQLIEIDLESTDNEVEVLGLRKLEEAIHSIIVRQSAPDWLPFAPGSSYWVPPRRHRHHESKGGIVSLLKKFTKPLTDEESMAVSSSRGWPSSVYFIEGTSTIQPVPLETEAEVVPNNEENIPDPDNEER